MAVTVLGNDPNHTKLHADTAAAQTALNALPATSAAALALATKELLRAQTAEVHTCIATGRLSPATILSTLS